MTELTRAVQSAPTTAASPPLAAQALSKFYGSAEVLTDVSLELRAGEVHAILGENGAGKSTLIKILSGTVRATSGRLLIDGEEATLATPHQALALGISVVHQEFNYCRTLNVTENLFLGRGLPRNRVGLVDWSKADRSATEALGELSVAVDVRTPVGELSPATRKLVEITRALINHSRVLILDEPTAALPAEESERLFDVMRRLRERGVAIGYVSHRLSEVLSLADRITILRDGHLIQTREAQGDNVDSIVRLMVGRPLSQEYPSRSLPPDPTPVLTVRDLSSDGHFAEVTLEVSAGEIFGVAGLEGSGRSELLRALSGDLTCEQGYMTLDGRPVDLGRSVFRMMQRGIAYVPPDRQHEGLHLTLDVSQNVSLPLLRSLGRGPFLSRGREEGLARKHVSQLDIRTAGIHQLCGALSGGNQQKVLLAKWLATKPRVLLLDEPTRGVDVGAKSEIHALMRSLAADGMVIVLASSDISELLGMSDRVLVMRAGRPAGLFDARTTTQEQIGFAATAATEAAPAA